MKSHNASLEPDTRKVFNTLRTSRIWLPVVLGTCVVLYLIASDGHSLNKLRLIRQADWRYMLLAFLAVIVRDVGYIYRIKVLTNNELTWLSSFYVIVLWEFSSAVTPSVVGGGIVAIFLLLKEKISLGKSLAYVIITSIFDNLFFISATTLGFFGVYDPIFTGISAIGSQLGRSLRWLFWLSYVLVLTYTLIMLLAIFVRPRLFKWLLIRITRIRFLRRWQRTARRHGEELVLVSKTLQGKPPAYWLRLGGITLVVWSVRYLVVNMIMAAYVDLCFIDHLMILGKQIIMWTIMLVSPTPGSSGTAEFFYKQLYESTLGEYTLITNILWRILAYYIYLILGLICLPRWVKRVLPTKETSV